MNPFTYARPRGDIGAALSERRGGAFIAGGTNLVDLMKEHVATPTRLVDINDLPLATIEEAEDGGLKLGALARNAATAYDARVAARYPLVAKAILAGASPQIRNRASNGGNLLQRTRCYYFYDTGTACNKRQPGSGCPAKTGVARVNAILGTSEACVATHPSDLCVALAAMEAVVAVRSPRGDRLIPFAEFHRLPEDDPTRDNTLDDDELIVSIDLPPAANFEKHSAYIKVRDRASYSFALVSVAAALDLDEQGLVREARIAVGGVAHKPWRVGEAEAMLRGQRPEGDVLRRVADRLVEGAQGFGSGPGSNAFKIELARRTVVRALQVAAAGGDADALAALGGDGDENDSEYGGGDHTPPEDPIDNTAGREESKDAVDYDRRRSDTGSTPDPADTEKLKQQERHGAQPERGTP